MTENEKMLANHNFIVFDDSIRACEKSLDSLSRKVALIGGLVCAYIYFNEKHKRKLQKEIDQLKEDKR